MTTTRDRQHLRRLGARVLGEANDLKRTPDALAAELGLAEDMVRRVIAGEADLATAEGVLRAMAETYPVSLADLWVERDDTDDGARIVRAAKSAQSRRVFDRAQGDGALTPYYEYRDTAMSRTAPFKPEWIQPLRVVADTDPDNPDVAFNNGHLMHQMTFFIGEVNFYWRAGGRSHAAEMNTGDSNYITPFVPHSFTSRRRDALGLIIAVTYAGQVRGALDDFARIGAEAATTMAGDLRRAPAAHGARLARHLAAESLTAEGFARRLADAGVDAPRARALAAGDGAPGDDELRLMAAALRVRAADLMVTPLDDADEVAVSLARETPGRPYPDGKRPAYHLTELARSRQQPGLKGFEITVLNGDAGPRAEFRHALHQYVYNYGVEPVELRWNGVRKDLLTPGDSAYLQPMTAHRFARPAAGGEGHLAVVRVPGALTDAVLDEYAAFAAEGRGRATGEDRTWF